ncbi:PREDICTED: zinc finger CCCH domain-containing protein 11A-like [Polistes dominula]|uniref:Zinc finger CCCH domain-containing protein 11A-like n=1 Tax=Polistes dominula TaxID=743375 RepID=A0ABM1JGW6_POLDO|nr:PREDICTED: zinc finger CCCH domain-containing protein 11A-like [Polistes dominula]
MEHSHKNTDCYFFYYSTCKKGELCPFRHEPSALGCETMCSYWQQGNCLNEHCSFRHMELKKNRKSIPCYWETQPSGCRKPHCPFLHKNVRAIYDPINPVKATEVTSKPINQDWVNRQDDAKYDTSSAESDQGRGSSEAGSFIGSPAVDPLIVKFGEESDNESIPSPVKTQPRQRVPYCKTYEEIRLEEIQAESAAYYSYNDEDDSQVVAKQPVGKYCSVMNNQYPKVVYNKTTTSKPVVLTQGIRRKIQADTSTIKIQNEEENNVEEDESMMPEKKRRKVVNNDKKKDNDTNELNFGILSLEEIRKRKKLKTLEKGVELLENVKSNLSKLFDESTPPPTPPTNDLSENPTKTNDLTTLRISNVTLTINRGVKGVLEKDKRTIESDENNRRVKAKLDNNNTESFTKVPPVRLRRSSKRHLNNITTNETVISKQQQQGIIPTTIINDNNLLLTSDQTSVLSDTKMNEMDVDNERIEQNLTERLDENLDVRVNMRDHSNSKRNEVEVRLCDSSTDEERMIIEDESKTYNNYDENEQAKTVSMDTIIEDSKASRFSYDSLLNINEDEYLTLDTASDDILKDIDALLKDKPVL